MATLEVCSGTSSRNTNNDNDAVGSGDVPYSLAVRDLLNRLRSTGYKTIAFTHTVYGRPRFPEDAADTVFPPTLWETKKGGKETSIRILRRLHGVIESLADLGHYSSSPATMDSNNNDDQSQYWNQYDLVSIAPRSEAIFHEVCMATPPVADIITLDYAATTRGLPFRFKAGDIQAATDRGMVFEFPYASAILNRKHRRHWMQASRDLQTVTLACNPRILFSSGTRIAGEQQHQQSPQDMGALALRLPEDLINLAKTVLRWDARTSLNVCGEAAHLAINHGRRRRCKGTTVMDAFITEKITTEEQNSHSIDQSKAIASQPTDNRNRDTGDEETPNEVEDGFIHF